MPKESDKKLSCKCIRCKHKWKAKDQKPISCPKCKTYSWEKHS